MFSIINCAARAYAQVGVETGVAAASPHHLVEMLFDAALEHIARAKEAIVARNPTRRGEAVSKVIRIVSEGLRASLDMQAGGEMAATLDQLYDYVTAQLVAATVNNRIAELDEVAQLLGALRDAWVRIAPPHAPAPSASFRCAAA